MAEGVAETPKEAVLSPAVEAPALVAAENAPEETTAKETEPEATKEHPAEAKPQEEPQVDAGGATEKEILEEAEAARKKAELGHSVSKDKQEQKLQELLAERARKRELQKADAATEEKAE